MEFPAGFLRGVMFNYNLPMFMNYAGIGGVIGHEISHGFDDRGRQYDAEGIEKKIIVHNFRSKCALCRKP